MSKLLRRSKQNNDADWRHWYLNSRALPSVSPFLSHRHEAHRGTSVLYNSSYINLLVGVGRQNTACRASLVAYTGLYLFYMQLYAQLHSF